MDQSALKSFTDLLSLQVVLLGAAILFGAWVLVALFDYLSQRISSGFPRYRLQVSRSFPIVRLLIWTVALYVVIVDVLSPPQNTVLAILASVGLAVGLAAQDAVKNIMSGIQIMFDQPFRVGDMIRVGEHYGEVVRIDTRNTRIRTFDDNIVSFPNSVVWTQAIANANNGNLDEMVVTKFFLPAYVDIQQIKDIAWEAAAASPYVYLRKPINVLVEDKFDRTFLTQFIIKAYVIDVRYERMLSSDILENVKSELVKRGLIDKSTVMLLASGITDSVGQNMPNDESSKEKKSIITIEN